MTSWAAAVEWQACARFAAVVCFVGAQLKKLNPIPVCVCVCMCMCCQVLAVLHESLPDLVGLDVDLATTTAAADALADADLLMAAGRGGGGGGGGGGGAWQYVPAPMLTVVGLVRRDTAGVGVMGSAGLSLAWPRAQVGSTSG